MSRKSNETSVLLDVVKTMPELSHNAIDGQPFNPENSDVLKWICSQPSVMNWIGQNLKCRGLIVYDQNTKKWHGVDYKSHNVSK